MYRRADFIWSEKQPVDPSGLIRILFGGRKTREEKPNRFFLFRRRVVLPRDHAPLRKCAARRR